MGFDIYLLREKHMSEKDGQDKKKVEEVIKEYIFEHLGKPPTLRHFIVKNVFECFYRVNIYSEIETNLTITVTEISDSFFMKVKDDEVQKCNPEITEKKYHVARNRNNEKL